MRAVILPAPRRQPPTTGRALPRSRAISQGGAGGRTPAREIAAPGGTRREADIQRAILEFLKLCPGVVAWRQNSGMAMLRGRGGRLQPVRFGVKGMADIIGYVTTRDPSPVARFLALEVKRDARTLTRDQAVFIGAVTRAGGIAAVVTSVEDVRQVLGR